MTSQIGSTPLNKTTSHLFLEAEGLVQAAIDRASEARFAGSGRSKGYASLTVIAVGFLFQSGGILAVGKFTQSDPVSQKPVTSVRFSPSEEKVVRANLDRILANVDQIQGAKIRVAPSMQIDGNVAAIRAAVDDVRTVALGKHGSVDMDP